MLPVLQYRASLFQRRKSLQAPQASQQQLAIQSSHHFILTHSSHNIFRLADELGLEEPFTDWTESSFFSPSGLVTEGPVCQSKPRLPALLGQAVHTFPLFRNMPLEDRLSMLPLFYAIIDHANDRETFAEDLVDDASEPSLELHVAADGAVVDSFLAERAIKLQEADAALAQRRDESARKLREARLQAEHPPIREPTSPVVKMSPRCEVFRIGGRGRGSRAAL